MELRHKAPRAFWPEPLPRWGRRRSPAARPTKERAHPCALATTDGSPTWDSLELQPISARNTHPTADVSVLYVATARLSDR